MRVRRKRYPLTVFVSNPIRSHHCYYRYYRYNCHNPETMAFISVVFGARARTVPNEFDLWFR
jgi:hypothetical protein